MTASPLVVVLAAGHGTRMRSAVPKVLHPICGRPMVGWPVRAALDAGADRVVVVGGPDRALAAHLPRGVDLAVQRDARGTGDAIRCAAAHIDPSRPLVVLPGDLPLIDPATIAELAAQHVADEAAVTVLRAGPDAADTDVLCFDGGALLGVLGRLDGRLSDAIPVLGAAAAAHATGDPSACLDVNDATDLAHARTIARRRVLAAHVGAGVTVTDPARTLIGAGVSIGAGTVIAGGCRLEGTTRIGRDCRLGPDVTARDAVLGDGVSAMHSILLGCRVAAGETVVPFTHRGPDATVRADNDGAMERRTRDGADVRSDFRILRRDLVGQAR